MLRRIRCLLADFRRFRKMGSNEREMIVWLANADTGTWYLITRLCQMEREELNDIWRLTSNASCIAQESADARKTRIDTELKLLQRLAAKHSMQLVSESRLAELEENWKKVKQSKKQKKNESKSQN